MQSYILYISIFAISSLTSLIIMKKSTYRKIILFGIVLFLPVLIATMREGIGTDYYSYKWYYQQTINGLNMTFMEPLFKILNYLSYWLFGDYKGVLFLSSLITYSFILAGLIKLKSDFSIALGLWIFYCYYFSASFNVVRQMIAVSIIFFALTLLNEKKYKQYILYVVIASMFHISAIIAIFFILIKTTTRKNVKLSIVTVFCLSVFIVFFGSDILNLLPDFIKIQYNSYIRNTDKMINLLYFMDIVPIFLIVAVPILIYIGYYRKSDKYDLYCTIGICVLPFLILGYNISYFQRVLYYIDIIQIVTVPLLIRQIRVIKQRFFIAFLVIVFFGFYFWYSTVYKGSNGIIPYTSSWI